MSDAIHVHILYDGAISNGNFERIIGTEGEIHSQREYPEGKSFSCSVDELDFLLQIGLGYSYFSDGFPVTLVIERVYFEESIVELAGEGESRSVDPEKNLNTLLNLVSEVASVTKPIKVIGDIGYVFEENTEQEDFPIYWLNIYRKGEVPDRIIEIEGSDVWKKEPMNDDFFWLILSHDPTAVRRNRQIVNS